MVDDLEILAVTIYDAVASTNNPRLVDLQNLAGLFVDDVIFGHFRSSSVRITAHRFLAQKNL